MSEKQKNIFHEALEEHETRLVRYAQKFLQNIESAQEIVQETFLRLWKEPPSKVASHMAPWLFHVCRNLCIERLRKVNKMNPNMKEPWKLVDQLAVAPDAFRKVEQRDQFDRLIKVIATLPEEEQEIMVLKFQNGFSYKEIAKVTGKSTNHVGVTLHKVMTYVREQMRKQDEQSSKGGEA